MIDAQFKMGHYFSFEQLANSYMLAVPEIKALLGHEGVRKVMFDQCCYGLRPPRSNETQHGTHTKANGHYHEPAERA